MHEVILLHARATESESPWYEELLGRLPYAKRLELERRAPQMRHASLAGLVLALEGARRLRPEAAEPACFEFPMDGKPRLRDGPAFSVSHAGPVVACAVTSTTDVGFDLEYHDPAGGARRAELRHWTATEAVLKARGLGVLRAKDVTLDAALTFGDLDGVRYALQPVDLGAGVIAHLATGGIASCRVEAYELDDPQLSATLQRSLALGA